MCFSATVSYGSAAMLVGAGIYAVRQARQLPQPYRLWALVPVFFGVQQALEGRVWQMLEAGNGAVVAAFGFHFFSHFLWLWWIPLCSFLVEPGRVRRRVFGGCAIFGAFAGALVYAFMLIHPEWMSVAVREHSIYYQYSVPLRGPFSLPISPATLYALTILVPLFGSSLGRVRIFGVLLALSMVLASVAYGYAYVSVWCFFAAVLSFYVVYMIHRTGAELKPAI